jgi:hypothetical protein
VRGRACRSPGACRQVSQAITPIGMGRRYVTARYNSTAADTCVMVQWLAPGLTLWPPSAARMPISPSSVMPRPPGVTGSTVSSRMDAKAASEVSAGRRGYRDAHAASTQTSPDSRFAVAGSDGVMLASGVTARAWYVRRRLAVRCCRHRVAFPQNPAQPCLLTTNPPSQPCRGRMGNSRSRMSPSPQPIASIDEPGYRPDGKSCRSCRAGTRSRIGPLDVQLSLGADSQCLERNGPPRLGGVEGIYGTESLPLRWT